MANYNPLISRKILEIIKKRRITQEELSKGIKRSKTSVSNWTSGRNKIDASSLKLIADFMEVPIGYFFDENADSSNMQISNNNNNTVIINGEQTTVSQLVERVKGLEQLLAEKERLIKILLAEKNNGKNE